MKHTFGRWLTPTVALCFSFLAFDTCVSHAAQSKKAGAVVQGRFVWADNTPVTNCRVKLVDKIDKLTVYPIIKGMYTREEIAISRDAQVRDTTVDAKGRFRFTGLPAGKYYLFFKAPRTFKNKGLDTSEDGWFYHYTDDTRYLRLVGYKDPPDSFKVDQGSTVDIPDIELVRLIVSDNPIAIPDKPGVFKFQWPEYNSDKFSRIAIEHQDYEGNLRHPLYYSYNDKRYHEVEGNTYQIPDRESLYPGRHRFMVEILIPTERVFAKSEWKEFVVPGEVLRLRVFEDEIDTCRRTIRWYGSDIIKSLGVSKADGRFCVTTSEGRVKLPPRSPQHECFFVLWMQTGTN